MVLPPQESPAPIPGSEAHVGRVRRAHLMSSAISVPAELGVDDFIHVAACEIEQRRIRLPALWLWHGRSKPGLSNCRGVRTPSGDKGNEPDKDDSLEPSHASAP
jgi:hypothetical protein